MKTKWVRFTTVVLVMLESAAIAATNDLSASLQRGLFEEEANHNLDAAIQAYQSVINQYDKDRKLAATAIFRLAESYRKQGKTNEATAQYERVLRDFTDQLELLTTSRNTLSMLGYAAKAGPTASLSQAARQEQKRLYEEEIKLAEKQLAAQKTQVDANGNLAPGDPIPIERDLLRLRRQLAALDDAQPSEAILDTPPTATTSAEAEEIKRIQAMIKDSPDLINAKTYGDTPLLIAARKGQLIVAQFLVANGADVEAKNADNETPLHLAALWGRKGIVELLLSKGAPPNAADNNGRTPLHMAASKGFKTVVEVLLAHRAEVNAKDNLGATPLHEAAANDYTAVAEVLLSQKADPNANASSVYQSTGLRGGTPLHVAATRGDKPMAELLLENKASVNITNGYGETPLHLAAPHMEVAKLLLQHGADVTIKSMATEELGATPLHYAVVHDQRETLALLLQNKADPNARFDLLMGRWIKGCTPLMVAALREQPEIVESLLAYKADPNLKSDGTTAIISALAQSGPASRNRTQIISLLLKNGADVNSRDQVARTPLIRAAIGTDKDLIKLLINHRADVNAQDNNGLSALHYLADLANRRVNVSELAEMILAAGADVNLRNKDGRTPLDMTGPPPPSAQGAGQELAELLRKHGALADLPRLDSIQIGRHPYVPSIKIFDRGTNDWNRFTLLDLLGVELGLLTGLPDGETRSRESLGLLIQNNPFGPGHLLQNPDFAHVRLRRAAANGRDWQETTTNLTAALRSGDCASDVHLEWGDVVDIPAEDRPKNDEWRGFSKAELDTLLKCLERRVEIVLQGKTAKVSLGFEVDAMGYVVSKAPRWIKPVLRSSKLLLPSSDLSRVKVRRHDAQTGQEREWVLDCSDSKPAPDFWLRDGDVIEVPDKS